MKYAGFRSVGNISQWSDMGLFCGLESLLSLTQVLLKGRTKGRCGVLTKSKLRTSVVGLSALALTDRSIPYQPLQQISHEKVATLA